MLVGTPAGGGWGSSEPGSEIQSPASAIQRWEATAEAAKEELDRLNPFPGTLGGGFGKSYSR